MSYPQAWHLFTGTFFRDQLELSVEEHRIAFAAPADLVVSRQGLQIGWRRRRIVHPTAQQITPLDHVDTWIAAAHDKWSLDPARRSNYGPLGYALRSRSRFCLIRLAGLMIRPAIDWSWKVKRSAATDFPDLFERH